MAALLALSAIAVVGCGKKDKTYSTFPDGYELATVDVGGMTAKEAKAALETAIEEYTISVTLDDETFDMNADDLELTYNEKADLQVLIDAANKDETSQKDVTLFKLKDGEALENALVDSYITAKTVGQLDESADADENDSEEDEADTTDADSADSTDDSTNSEEIFDIRSIVPYRATIEYDAQQATFVGVDGVSGDAPTYDNAATQLTSAVEDLKTTVEVQSSNGYVDGELAADSDYVQEALDDANAYLDLTITCNFNPVTGTAATETIGKDQIATWLIVGNDGLSVALDEETMSTYCTQIAGNHDTATTRNGLFKTTSGGTINVKVASSGQTVDANALYESVYEAIENKESATVEAVYSEAAAEDTGEYVTYGGSYCEVDLTNQMVYVYKDGQLVVSSSCVTGSVSKGYNTPTGVYSIFSRDKDRYLRGDGYKSWVNFFVPFNGGIGFHDASWRSTFGGNIYLYSGSHGCINMSYSAAKKLYENVTIGEKVIVYGGVTTVEGKAQVWSGTSAYNVTEGDGTFKLDMTCQDSAKLTYSSNNAAVANVDENGNVTIGGTGTATITVKSEATASYKAGTTTITVTVNPKQNQTVQQPTQTVNQTPSITIKSSSNMTVTEGTSSSISASASNGAKLSYTSSNSIVASVDANGKVTANKAGSATITITANAMSGWNSATATVNVTVTAKSVTPTITIQNQPSSMTVGQTVNIGANVNPSAAGISYLSSDSGKATVDSNGNVTAKTAGEVTITVKSGGSTGYNATEKSFKITITDNSSSESTETN